VRLYLNYLLTGHCARNKLISKQSVEKILRSVHTQNYIIIAMTYMYQYWRYLSSLNLIILNAHNCSYTNPLPPQDLHFPIAEANNTALDALRLPSEF
jgi:hypothetical protein